MDTDNLKSRLVSIIANIEERTDSELIAIIKETLMRVGTGTPIDDVNEQYQLIYRELDERLRKQNAEHPNHFEDLWDFYSYWKENNLDTYASRRSYVKTIYRLEGNHDPHWTGINSVIKGVAKPRFDNKQYADAVESAFKEINSRVKEEMRQITGKELDGASLMNKAFSPNDPIIILEDLETDDGKNIQQGYMQMFAGAIIAIRNPKAHSNLEIEKEEAIPLLQLASLLFTKFENAIKRRDLASSTKSEENTKPTNPGLYIRIRNPDDHEHLLMLKKILSQHVGSESVVIVLGTEKKSAIRLPMKVKISKKLLTELGVIFGEASVVEVK